MAVRETTFTIDTSSIKFGPGATREVGDDLRTFAVKRAMVVTDPIVAKLPVVAVTLASLKHSGIDAVLFDRVRVEPNEASLREAIAFALEGRFDGYVAVGGGSSIDTAKVANLYACYPAEFLTYVNAPIGLAQPVPGPLKPLIAIPTTAGTGSETTGVAIFDLQEKHFKTGIAHRALRPRIGIVDSDNTRTMPTMVAACCAMDILCHALESLTALPYCEREAPAEPRLRPAYQGANPISDIWAAQAVTLVSKYLLRVLADSQDEAARSAMLLASTYAGMGFGNAGVHLPHGMSYPVSSMVRDYRPPGYTVDHALVPHGMSVILNAPAVFRFTAAANPARHLYAAKLLGVDVTEADERRAGELLAQALIDIMQATGMPNGLSAVGFSELDIEALAEGTLPQQRVTKLSPRPATKDDLMTIFQDAMSYW